MLYLVSLTLREFVAQNVRGQVFLNISVRTALNEYINITRHLFSVSVNTDYGMVYRLAQL